LVAITAIMGAITAATTVGITAATTVGITAATTNAFDE